MSVQTVGCLHAALAARKQHGAHPAMDARVVPVTCLADFRLSDGEFLAKFTLPGPADKCTELQRQNPLPRESRIVFYEDAHLHNA